MASNLVIERDTIGDTVVVRTTSGSAWGDSVQLTEELRIGDPNGDVNYAFGRVVTMDVGDDGTIHVFDDAMKTLRAYDSTGRYLRTIGGQGGGPGEYQSVVALATLHDGRLLLRDLTRINIYATDGSPIGSWPATGGPMMGPNRLALVSDGHGGVYTTSPTTPTMMGGRMVLGSVIVHLDSTGVAHDTIPMPAWPDLPLPLTLFSPRGLSALTQDGVFVTARSDYPAVNFPLRDGRVLRMERPSLIAIPLAPGEHAEQQEFFDALAKRNPGGEHITVPETKPIIRSLQVASDGRIWTRLHAAAIDTGEPTDGAPAEIRIPSRWVEPEVWEVFDTDGIFLGRLELPLRSSVLAMRGDHVWGTVLDENDVPYLVRWRIDGTQH